MKQQLGLEESETVDELLVSLFDGATAENGRVELSMEESAAAVIHDAADLAREGNDEAAGKLIKREFGSVCNEEHPDAMQVGEERESRCLRHKEEYRSPGEVIDERYRNGDDSSTTEAAGDD